jgi:hypothetical protein
MAFMPTQRQTYRAILQGSQIIWLDPPPNLPDNVEVSVTVTQPNSPSRSQGEAMAAALEKLAQRHIFKGIDPVAWQQEIRQDKPLHGRE